MINQTICVSEINLGNLSAVKLEGVENFSVRKTFDCGQCFRFDEVLDSIHECEFAGVADGKYISFAQDGDTFYIYNSTIEDYRKIWESFLSLDTDYNNINESILSLSDNVSLRDAVNLSSGIRILRQDRWEAICSFIISQNNNIPRIKKLVSALCYACDENKSEPPENMKGHIADAHIDIKGSFSPFPAADKVKELGVDGLFSLKTGFRAKYIYDAAQKVADGELCLDEIDTSMSLEKCSDILCSVKGVGPKVAACALLFGFGKLDAFPVDVWIKRVIQKYFDESFDPKNLGEYAGVAQQYLFYFERYLQNKE